MAPYEIDPKAIKDAADKYAGSRLQSGIVIGTLAQSLNRNWGCAGTDTSARTWSQSYDPAAYHAVQAGTKIVNGFGKLYDLLAFSSVNHQNSHNAAMIPPGPVIAAPSEIPGFDQPQFNGAYGGDSPAPFGWDLIVRWLQGHFWPNDDPDKLRDLGSAWDTAAAELRTASNTAGPAWAVLEDLNSPDLNKALAQIDLVSDDVEELATQFENLGKACRNWAGEIEDAHKRIIDILTEALGWAIVAGVVGGIIGSLAGPAGTAGGASVAAGAAAEGAAIRIIPILVGLENAAIEIALGTGAIAAVGAAAGVVAANLDPLLLAQPSVMSIDSGGMVSGAGGNYYPAPKDLEGFPGTRLANRKSRMPGGRTRKRWTDDDGNIYEWDYQHGAVEKYNKRGVHQGEYDPSTGTQTKPPDPTRRVEP